MDLPRSPRRPRRPLPRCAGAVLPSLLVALAIFLAAPAVAQGNPLDRKQPPPTPDQALDLPVYFEGDGLIVSIERVDTSNGRVEGRVMLGENAFPHSGTVTPDGTITGAFVANGEEYDFTAVENDDDSVTFTTGDTSYTMQQVARPSRALPAEKTRRTPERTASDVLTGEWRGTGTDQAEDGTPMTFTITLVITRTAQGSVAAELQSNVAYPVGNGQTVPIDLRGRFTGPAAEGALELRSPEVTASANGQTDSLGAQTLRLQPKGGGVISGRLGNDVEGWSHFEVRKQQTPAPAGGPDDANQPRTTPNATPATAPQGTVVLEQVRLEDPGLNNMVSHTLLKPQGWQVQGGQQWTPQAFRDFVHLNLRVAAADGRGIAVYPGGFYEDSNIYEITAQMGGRNMRPQPGQVLNSGIRHMPLPGSAGEYVTNVLFPINRPQATNLRVVNTTQLPPVQQQIEAMFAPVIENARRGDQQMRQMGGYSETTGSVLAERVRVAYQEQGQAFEEDVWVLGFIQLSAEKTQPDMPIVHTAHWTMFDSRGIRAPAGQLDRARPLLEAISLSIQENPRYAAVIMDLQQRINRQQIDTLRRRGEITRQAQEEAWATHQAGVRQREESNDRMHDHFMEYVQDIDRYQDVDGQTVKLPGLYSHVYSSGDGKYLLSNEPTLDPNDISQQRWERINPKR